jgi:hypothetical protein
VGATILTFIPVYPQFSGEPWEPWRGTKVHRKPLTSTFRVLTGFMKVYEVQLDLVEGASVRKDVGVQVPPSDTG